MSKDAPIYQYTHAIVRRPAPSVVEGLRKIDIGAPDFEGVLAEHDAYVTALENAGVDVTVLPALSDFPDSIFVEDPALVFPEGAILLKPGAKSRQGEVAEIAPTLESKFENVLGPPTTGFVDGGDILHAPEAVMIGLSSRTDKAGAFELSSMLETFGYNSRVVETPPDVLHFKSDCALLDEETILTTKRLERSGVFKGYDAIVTPDGEEGAANALRINDVVFISAEHPKTIEQLQQKGFDIVPLSTAQIAKIDAGLSCMSLRWRV